MNGIFCLLNKKCRIEKSKELVDNLQIEQKSVEDIYSNITTITADKEDKSNT